MLRTTKVIALVACVFPIASTRSLAIEGPGVNTIPDVSWGVFPADLWPHVPRVEIDGNMTGVFGDGDGHCTAHSSLRMS
jgi:hypothetical protein